MDIKIELLQNCIYDFIKGSLENCTIDVNNIANKKAISALNEIKNILCNNNLSDFDAIEEIVCIFEEYGIDTGGRHDF